MVRNINTKTKNIMIVSSVVVLGFAAFAFYVSDKSNESNIVKTNDEGGIINYQPPTKEEQESGDKQKEIIDDQQEKQQENTTQKKNVSVVITDAAQYGGVIEVRSFVPSYSQDGTCTLAFTQGARSFARTTPGYKDVSSTVCPAVEIKKSEFPSSGEWQVVVKFESNDAKGQSEPRMFTVE